MLINEVLDSKSIALSATENASNQIPYLGLQWFPERKKQGLDLSWIKTHKGYRFHLRHLTSTQFQHLEPERD